ncbi:MAG: helix-turn-helix domain-containing protein [Desulfovibrionaceae bacterium]
MPIHPAAPDTIRFWRDPLLPYLEARYAAYAECTLARHAHDQYSVACVMAGERHFFFRNAQHAVGPGDITCIDPGEIHACAPRSDSGLTYCMYYIEADWFTAFAAEVIGPDSHPPSFTRNIITAPSLFKNLVALYPFLEKPSSRLEKESRIRTALAPLVRSHCGQPRPARAPSPATDRIERVRIHLRGNLTENVSLETLATLAGVSPYHLLRTFKKATGLAPHAYQNQLRITHAKSLIAAGVPLCQAALEAGFSDQCHFAKMFKRHVGATPRQYKMGGAPRG